MEVDSDLIADMEKATRNLHARITVMERFFEVDVVKPLEDDNANGNLAFEARAHYGEINRAMQEIEVLRTGFRRICFPHLQANEGGH